MTDSQSSAGDSGHDQPEESADEQHGNSDSDDRADLKQVAEVVQRVQNGIDDLEPEVSIDLFKRLDHLEGAAEAIEDWADDAEDDDLDAIAGAQAIVDAEQTRVGLLREKAPDGRGELLRKFETLEDSLEDLEDTVDAFTFTTNAYIVYVNQQFVGRYTNDQVDVETILRDAGKKSPEELGLFPLDGFRGSRQTDQAFPANETLDLDGPNRTHFESTSDGGKIA
ncbi:hypothetical protein [Halobacterium rubrum]|uniref:hypothetical protein n=1 Tax=Halobacterium TaxID=2239 RepID=UPI001F2E24C8|nr:MULTISPECIES: hypothetical protein [Halobacterium]MDH5021683.1 hypothetical protein [Halobacterium rubrum]